MKKIIIYDSKTGTTEDCAKILKEKLKDIEIVNIKENRIDIKDYDLIIIGSPIRMGIMSKNIRKFIQNNYNELLKKKIAYFICCGFHENVNKYYETNIPKELLDKAVCYRSFGGKMDIDKQKGIDKLIVKMVSKSEDGKREVKILTDEINKFVNIVNNI